MDSFKMLDQEIPINVSCQFRGDKMLDFLDWTNFFSFLLKLFIFVAFYFFSDLKTQEFT